MKHDKMTKYLSRAAVGKVRLLGSVSAALAQILTEGPKEELLGLLPLTGQTRGEDIAIAVVQCMGKYDIPLERELCRFQQMEPKV
ncbi:hypothetical protein TNCV_3762441 [Trichonephila clavipes]|nr:hypothetical protein TNCV_3762441 [Trichonephila clavipes]